MTESLWHEYLTQPTYPRLLKDEEADVCVVGAGISGLTAAYLLASSGFSVVVLEDQNIGSGQTGRTSAHLSNALDDRYFVLEQLHGQEGARLAAQSHTVAIRTIADIVKEEKIDCEFKWVNGYLFLSPGDPKHLLDHEFEAARRAGLDVQKVERAPISSFNSGPALCFPKQAQYHPLKYLFQLAQACTKKGVKIFTQTHATTYDDGSPLTIKTNDGPTVHARDVIFATNVPVNTMVSIHTKQAAYRSYVVAFPLIGDVMEPALYWDTQEAYHYVRLFNRNGQRYLIVGGEDHKTGQLVADVDPFEVLQSWAKVRFPITAPISMWSGQIIETMDGLAFIGRISDKSSHVYVVTGDSGNGLTHGTLAGLIIRDLIRDGHHPWAHLYDPNRKMLRSAKDFIKENMNAFAQYTDWVKGHPEKDIESLPLNEGIVVTKGTKKIAVYKDARGCIYECNAICPHLKGIVRWNDLEKTWDCPAHGSRFEPTGKVLNGPANSDLEPLKHPSEIIHH